MNIWSGRLCNTIVFDLGNGPWSIHVIYLMNFISARLSNIKVLDGSDQSEL